MKAMTITCQGQKYVSIRDLQLYLSECAREAIVKDTMDLQGITYKSTLETLVEVMKSIDESP